MIFKWNPTVFGQFHVQSLTFPSPTDSRTQEICNKSCFRLLISSLYHRKNCCTSVASSAYMVRLPERRTVNIWTRYGQMSLSVRRLLSVDGVVENIEILYSKARNVLLKYTNTETRIVKIVNWIKQPLCHTYGKLRPAMGTSFPIKTLARMRFVPLSTVLPRLSKAALLYDTG